jgi:hypothetical protein
VERSLKITASAFIRLYITCRENILKSMIL